jgi:hypothetical protein
MRVELRQEGVVGGSPQKADELKLRQLDEEALDLLPLGSPRLRPGRLPA